ncbi:hypothetical protein [Pseudarthrobacter enclensis]|uniref:hypothetical protein n=1 Tax=Pseudarthrobacter enclensis TaxID=993070 RepID=UPI001146CA79|nr:hypothetical protein [Pseudarthrobacter enclensis]
MEATTGENHVPRPESITDLIDRIVTSKWPADEVEQAKYFALLGFDPIAGQSSNNDAAVMTGNLMAPSGLPIATATWASLNGNLFSINVFLDGELLAEGPHALRTYRHIYAGLRGKYGPPLDETTDLSGRASSKWQMNGTTTEMYCHLNPLPSVQLGFSHTAGNAEYEALPSR